MDDKKLRQFIIDELEFEPSIDAAHIGVAVEDGVVTLTGHVDSHAQKVAAEHATQRVKGVKAIAQEIQVRYPFGRQTADDQLAKRAADILAWSAVPDENIKVVVQKGWLTLSGTVDWQYQKTAAEAAVRDLEGITGVTNLIQVKARAQPSDVKKKITAALHRDAQVEADAIQISVKEGKVTLEGKVKTWYERGVVERAAWSVPGVTLVDDKLKIG